MSKRAEILTLANRELQEKGVSSLSFRELAAKLDIKSSSVHYYFPQKDDLIEAIIADYSEGTLTAVRERTEILPPGKPRLLAVIDLIREKLEHRQCTAGILAAESAQVSEKAKKVISVFFHKLSAWLTAEMRALGKDPKEAQILGNIVMTSIEGALMIGSVEADESYLKNLKDFIKGL